MRTRAVFRVLGGYLCLRWWRGCRAGYFRKNGCCGSDDEDLSGKLMSVWVVCRPKVRLEMLAGAGGGLRNDNGALGLKTAAVKCMICLDQGLNSVNRPQLESQCMVSMEGAVCARMRMTLDCERGIPIAEGWWQRNVKIMLLKIERADCSECKAKR